MNKKNNKTVATTSNFLTSLYVFLRFSLSKQTMPGYLRQVAFVNALNKNANPHIINGNNNKIYQYKVPIFLSINIINDNK